MKTAGYLLATFFLALFAGAGYGITIDRFGMFIGALPGLVGLVGLLLWLGSDDALQAQESASHAARVRIRNRAIRDFKETRMRGEYRANNEMQSHYLKG